jgi:hypothetical protein
MVENIEGNPLFPGDIGPLDAAPPAPTVIL